MTSIHTTTPRQSACYSSEFGRTRPSHLAQRPSSQARARSHSMRAALGGHRSSTNRPMTTGPITVAPAFLIVAAALKMALPVVNVSSRSSTRRSTMSRVTMKRSALNSRGGPPVLSVRIDSNWGSKTRTILTTGSSATRPGDGTHVYSRSYSLISASRITSSQRTLH